MKPRTCRDCGAALDRPAARYCAPCGRARQAGSWHNRLRDEGPDIGDVDAYLSRAVELETAPAWVRKEAGLV